ncbi:MAG: carbohydrate kinase family protein [Candidatus Moranbacteria bacterium]|nr:carbohydrate kinase family protein [Candidatus Moranbacteria bacterium]
MKKVICIGSATKDIFITLNETKITENKKSLTEKKLMSFEFGAKIYAENLIEEVGGSAVNVAAGLNLGEVRSFVFARTSKSEVGKWVEKRIGKLKVKKNYMQRRGSEPSEVSAIISDKANLDHVIMRTGDSVEWFDLEKALNKFREKVDWIYVGSQKKNSLDKMKKIVEFAENKKAKIVFIPSSYQIENDLEVLSAHFEKIEIIFVNRDEALEILQNLEIEFKDEPSNLLQEIKKLGFEKVVITDGAKGAYVCHSEGSFHLGINKTKKIETVGAGDAFASGFLSAYIDSADIKKSLAWGIANSGAVLTEIGSTKGLLNKKEMKNQETDLIKKIKPIK